MHRTTTVIIGAGQAGLAMSRSLAARSIDHVVLERGDVANSWRRERWDSLRLLTPNWLNRLPGMSHDAAGRDDFMTMDETIALLDRYASFVNAPVVANTAVLAVRRREDGYFVRTDGGNWHARSVVIASGAFNLANRPRWASEVPAHIHTLTPMDYRNPDRLGQGPVLVVGASASGMQIAKEVRLSGREVTLAVGEHVRAPRTYRGHDILYWMDKCGILSRRIEDADDIRRARRVPSLQLAGGTPAETLDLNSLQDLGVRIVGRAMGCSGSTISCSGSLANMCALADLKLNRLLGEIDGWIADERLHQSVTPGEPITPTAVPADPALALDLSRGGIRTIIWATGYRPDYSWLDVPVLTPRGELRHDRGVVEAPGLYVLGLPFMRKRLSSFIAGAGDDAEALAAHLQLFLAGNVRAAA